MRLSTLQRWGFFLLGAVAAAVAGWAYSRSEMTIPGLFVFLPGLLLIVGAMFGTAPNVTFKDTKVEWPKGEESNSSQPGLDKEAIEKLRLEMQALYDEQSQKAKRLSTELERVSTRLEDYILAHQAAPDDGLTDEERLEEWLLNHRDVASEVSWRTYREEGYSDGVSTAELAESRDQGWKELEQEHRRQKAQFTFGMREKPPRSIYDD